MLDNVSVQGALHTGGLVGDSFGLIEEVGIRGLSIPSANDWNVGFIGRLHGARELASSSSYVLGTITATNDSKVGGLVGKLVGASLMDSYAHVDVSGYELEVLWADAPSSNSNQVRRNYSTGSVTYSTRGGAIGDNETVAPPTFFEDNYYDNVTDTSVNNYPKATPATTAQLQQTQDNTQRSFLAGTS